WLGESAQVAAAGRARRRALIGGVARDGGVPEAARSVARHPAHRARHGRGVRRRQRHLGAALRRRGRERVLPGNTEQRACAADLPGNGSVMLGGKILAVEDIHTYYGDAYVLQGLSLELGAGQILGLLGRNGVGKTTLVNSIVGFNRPRRGRIVFKGVDITGFSSFQTIRNGMGLVPQGRRVFASLSVEENLLVAQRHPERHKWNVDRVFKLFPRLHERRNQRANTLSGGEEQMRA